MFLDDIDFVDSLREVHTHFIPNMFQNPSNANSNAQADSCMTNEIESAVYTGVVNLSSHKLTDNELSLLSKGLTFVNTPHPQI